MPFKIISALGDSITQGAFDESGLGWFGRLTQKVAAHSLANSGYTFCSHNMSLSGDRICDAYHRFAPECLTRDIDILIINIGCNDLVRRGAPDAPMDLSIGLRAEYWNWLLDMAIKNIPTVLVLDILPIREETDETDEDDIYEWNKDIKEYNDQIAQLCAARNIPFIRRFEKWEKRNLADYYVDYGHPNGAGHQLIADEIYAELEKLKII